MDNPGSSIISALGAGSGIDFGRLARDLSEASFGFQRETIVERNSALEARISAASVLRSTLNSLASALGDRIRSGDLASRATIGNTGVARVTTTPGTSPKGIYSLEVSQLAGAQKLVTPAYTGGDALVGEGNLRIRFGTVSGSTFSEDAGQSALDLAIGATDTLASLASKITKQSNGALNAYVAQGSSGAQLVIKGRDGAVNGFTLEGQSASASPASTPGDLSYLDWSPATDAGQLRSGAQDALFSLDTVTMRSASNRVTGLPEGITLNLTGTNQGAPTTLSFSQDSTAISAVMTDFTAALNDVVALLNGGEDGDTSLANDSGARELRRDLTRLTNDIVMPGAAAGDPRTLADLGLSLTREGNFRLDSERLTRTLAERPEAAAAMFTVGARGVFATMDSLARATSAVGDPSSLSGSVKRAQAQVERNGERLQRIAEQQESLRQRLTRNLSAAESRIASAQSTLGFLRAQFDNSDK